MNESRVRNQNSVSTMGKNTEKEENMAVLWFEFREWFLIFETLRDVSRILLNCTMLVQSRLTFAAARRIDLLSFSLFHIGDVFLFHLPILIKSILENFPLYARNFKRKKNRCSFYSSQVCANLSQNVTVSIYPRAFRKQVSSIRR